MSRVELIQRCRNMGIKGVSSKTKDELMQIIGDKESRANTAENVVRLNKLDEVLKQLLEIIPRDKVRKVCKNCNEIGHGVSSTNCRINIEKNNKLKKIIKDYFLLQNCLLEKSVDQHCEELSIKLGITSNFCKTLYSEIPAIELLERPMDIEKYIEEIKSNCIKCNECHKNIYNIQINTNRLWKGNQVCDSCWSNHEEERDELWRKVKQYRKVECHICGMEQKMDGERFHYDHINMFNKGDSICSMVGAGLEIDDIYAEIDKCQILCLKCHHLVTDIESRLGFTRIKQMLSRQLNGGEIGVEDYDRNVLIYQQKYEEKIGKIYEEIKKKF